MLFKKRISFFVVLLAIFASITAWPGGQPPPDAGPGAVPGVVGKYIESPMLAARVAAGELPPVEERLPLDPSVLEPLEEVGKHGGTIRVFATDNLPWQDLQETPARQTYLLKVAKDGSVVGDMGKGWEISDDKRAFTVYLREGTMWSDGHPFTVDDIIFMFEDIHWHPDLQSWNLIGQVNRVVGLDPYTVRFMADDPMPVIPLQYVAPAGGDWFCFLPKHYMQKWHIKYNPDADKLAKEEGHETWQEAIYYHYWWAPQKDLDKPTLQPWIIKEFTTTNKVYERNPYYWKVDTAGNQLPYIDNIVATIVDQEVYNLKIISGEADVAFLHTSFENYTLYKENEASGNYRVVPVPGLNGSDVTLSINMNMPDPVERKIYNDIRVRQALSLAINREEINNVVYYGQAFPRQQTVLPSVSYFKKEWEESFAQYDPAAANKLLDEAGLTNKDRDGFRLRPDRNPLLVLIEYTAGGGEGVSAIQKVLELVKEYWEDVGLKTLLKAEEAGLINQRRGTPDHGIMVMALDGCEEIRNYTSGAEYWHGGGSDFSWANAWGRWLGAEYSVKMGRTTLADYEGGVLPGEEPPQDVKDLNAWALKRDETEFGSPEYMELSQEIFGFHAKNLFMIGTVGMAPLPYIAKNNIGNVPKTYGPAHTWAGDLNYYAEQLFFK